MFVNFFLSPNVKRPSAAFEMCLGSSDNILMFTKLFQISLVNGLNKRMHCGAHKTSNHPRIVTGSYGGFTILQNQLIIWINFNQLVSIHIIIFSLSVYVFKSINLEDYVFSRK